jgi:hypothetical protein
MDLNQDKLSKREWDNTEIPVSQYEKEILKLIYMKKVTIKVLS